MKKLVLVGGGTGSGKTVIAKLLKKQYEAQGLSATLMSMDNYYKDLNDLPEERGMDVNWDSPNVMNWNQFDIDIAKLINGENVKRKTYEFETFSYPGGEVEYESNDVIILEGIFALFSDKARELATSKIFVHTDDDIRLIRRAIRDSNGRYKIGFNHKVFMHKWLKEVSPMHKKHVNPTKQHADFIINNNEEFKGEEKERMVSLLQSLVVK